MQDRWRNVGINLLQWVGVPLVLGLIGFYVIGPRIGGTETRQRTVAPPPGPPQTVAAVDGLDDGQKEWVRPDPPQIDISVEPVDDEDEDSEVADPPPIGAFEEGEADEAGIGGLVRPKNESAEQQSSDEGGIGGLVDPPRKVKQDDD